MHPRYCIYGRLLLITWSHCTEAFGFSSLMIKGWLFFKLLYSVWWVLVTELQGRTLLLLVTYTLEFVCSFKVHYFCILLCEGEDIVYLSLSSFSQRWSLIHIIWIGSPRGPEPSFKWHCNRLWGLHRDKPWKKHTHSWNLLRLYGGHRHNLCIVENIPLQDWFQE